LNSAVFLDRDGVINQALIRENMPFSPRNIDELVILNDVSEAVSLLHRYGFVTVVVTNQPDIARGFMTLDTLLKIHDAISARTSLQYFYSCTHDEDYKCNCRKPKIGLLIDAARDLNLDLSKSFLVGDRWKDIRAGQSAGCQCFFIDNGYSEQQPSPPFHTVASLLEAAIIITGGVKC